MKQPVAPPLIETSTPPRWLWVVLAVILVPLLALGGVAAGVASYFFLSSDARALRNGLSQASGAKWRQKIELNVGDFTLGAVRTGLSFTHLDPKAKTALRAARGVEVGVYELNPGSGTPDPALMLVSADRVMSARGWERLVGVLDHDQMVSVFLPAGQTPSDRVKCCVAVMDGRQMVVVAGRADLKPLLELLRAQPEWRDKFKVLAKL